MIRFALPILVVVAASAWFFLRSIGAAIRECERYRAMLEDDAP